MSPALQALDQHECSESRPDVGLSDGASLTVGVRYLERNLFATFHVETDRLGQKLVVLDRVCAADSKIDILPLLTSNAHAGIVRFIRRDVLGLKQDGFAGMLQRAANTACAMTGMNPHNGVRR